VLVLGVEERQARFVETKDEQVVGLRIVGRGPFAHEQEGAVECGDNLTVAGIPTLAVRPSDDLADEYVVDGHHESSFVPGVNTATIVAAQPASGEVLFVGLGIEPMRQGLIAAWPISTRPFNSRFRSAAARLPSGTKKELKKIIL
jgi:hypothetical protein